MTPDPDPHPVLTRKLAQLQATQPDLYQQLFPTKDKQ